MFNWSCCSLRTKKKNNLEVQLSNATNEIPLFNFKDLKISVKVVDVYDGDTFTGCFIFKDQIIKYKFRTIGYDSPEMKPLRNKPNREQEKIKAKEAREKFIEYSNCQNNLIIVECQQFDKYGRILGTVFNKETSENINQKMIDNGYGLPYDGGTKKEFTFTV